MLRAMQFSTVDIFMQVLGGAFCSVLALFANAIFKELETCTCLAAEWLMLWKLVANALKACKVVDAARSGESRRACSALK